MYGLDAQAPYNGAIYDLTEGRWLYEGNKVRLQPAAATGGQARKVSSAYQRLQAACQRLAAVIADNEGGANKDLARFADQIIALCDKWDRCMAPLRPERGRLPVEAGCMSADTGE